MNNRTFRGIERDPSNYSLGRILIHWRLLDFLRLLSEPFCRRSELYRCQQGSIVPLSRVDMLTVLCYFLSPHGMMEGLLC